VKKLYSIRQALEDPDIFGNILAGESWAVWRVILTAAMGEALTCRERKIFERVTGGRKKEPGEVVDHLVCLVGRRGGKIRAASVLAVYLAALVDYSSVAAPGERLRLLFLARNQKQAAVCFSYCSGIFDTVPMLGELVVNRTQEVISLSNGVDLEIMAANAAGIRGVTAAAVLADEACHWLTDSESTNADSQILNAARPSLATTGGPMIIISSVYARRGETFNLWEEHYGSHGDPPILIVQGGSRDFNRDLPQSVIDRAIARDPSDAAAEYLSQWRDDVAGLVSYDTLNACTGKVAERAPIAGIKYTAGVDFAGGSGQDSLALSICHFDEKESKVVVDLVCEWKPPFSPSAAMKELAGVVHCYGVNTVIGDRWGGGFPREALQHCGLYFRPSDYTTSDCYLHLLPLLNSRECEIPQHPTVLAQLGSLKRQTSSLGKDRVTHPSNQHDDAAV
jgi:hypothetical protein